MAETQGFEPWVPFWGYAHLANECLQPLGHVSVMAELAYSFLKGNAVYKKGTQLYTGTNLHKAELNKITTQSNYFKPFTLRFLRGIFPFSGIRLASDYLPVSHRDKKNSGKSLPVN